MSEKTHWRKLTHPDYLGAYEWAENEKDKIVTIDHVTREDVIGTAGKKQECVIAKLRNGIKPLILNRTNMKTITKLCGSPYIEDWAGLTISLYITKTDAFGEITDGIRIRSKLPQIKKPVFDQSHKGWSAAIKALQDGSTTVDTIMGKYDVGGDVEALLRDAERGAEPPPDEVVKPDAT